MRASLAMWLWFRVTHEVAVKFLPNATAICFQDDSFTQLLAGGLSCSLCGTLHNTVEHLHDTVVNFSQRGDPRDREEREPQCHF